MTKIDIISGFLGAGKTTLIKKLISEAFQGEKLVLIENEFGEINVDSGFLKNSGIEISEMSAGCICCTLVGDFQTSLMEVYNTYHPDRILIEPSGVGKLSDVILAVENAVKEQPELNLNSFSTVADGSKVKIYMQNFGEFYNNQIETAGTIILSRTQKLSQEKLEKSVKLLREHNADAAIITTPWDDINGQTILTAIEKVSLADELLKKMQEEHDAHEAEHHHHHHDHDENCTCGCHDHDHEHEHHHHHHDEDEVCPVCGHHHDHDEECHEHEHHHHDHDEECHCHDHEHEHEHHHHDHDEECHCHDHEHEHEHHHHHDGECSCGHHHHHHADEVFDSWGKETANAYSAEEIDKILTALDNGEYGKILRAKGIVNGTDGKWIEFDYVPEEHEIREGNPDYTGRLCVIGAELDTAKLADLFRL